MSDANHTQDWSSLRMFFLEMFDSPYPTNVEPAEWAEGFGAFMAKHGVDFAYQPHLFWAFQTLQLSYTYWLAIQPKSQTKFLERIPRTQDQVDALNEMILSKYEGFAKMLLHFMPADVLAGKDELVFVREQGKSDGFDWSVFTLFVTYAKLVRDKMLNTIGVATFDQLTNEMRAEVVGIFADEDRIGCVYVALAMLDAMANDVTQELLEFDKGIQVYGDSGFLFCSAAMLTYLTQEEQIEFGLL